MTAADAPTGRELLVGAARATAGALLFGVPLLLTREMWDLGVVLDPWRLVVFVVVALPGLVLLVRYLGFRDTSGMGLADEIADALVAYGIGAVTSSVALVLLGVVDSTSTAREVVGLIAIESVPASVGAAIARSQFVHGTGSDGHAGGYAYELLLMVVGALSLAFAVAPTEEVVLIATRIADPRGLVLVAMSVLGMHAVVYLMGFKGQHRSDAPRWSVFLGYTVTGYATTLVVCAALLWVFGRTDGVPFTFVALQTVVLAVPGALGAAAARLLL